MFHTGLLWVGLAAAQQPGATLPPRRWGASATAGTAMVLGYRNPGTEVATATGTVAVDPTFNPRLDWRLGLSARYRPGTKGWLSATWGLRQTLAFSDAEGVGLRAQAPAGGQLDGSDLQLAFSDPSWWATEDGRLHLTGGVRLTLPASRASLACNPLLGSLGLDGGLWVGLGGVSTLAWTASLDRTQHLYAAPPAGGASAACGGSDGAIATATGSVSPTAAQGPVPGAANPAWTVSTSLALRGWHQIFAFARAKGPNPFFDRVLTDLRVGLVARTRRRAANTEVATATGSVALDPAQAPLTAFVPVSLGLTLRPLDPLLVSLRAGNHVPTLLTDPGATFAALPATTSLSLSLTGLWQ